MSEPEEIPMISQPLLDSEGRINPACINELEATIAAAPKSYDRLSNDPEWTKKEWTFPKDIVGAFAMWACRQSPYGVPDGLENVCKYLNAALNTVTQWDVNNMAQCSLCDINKWLYEILYEQGVKEFDAWNQCKAGDTPDIKFVSAHDGPTNPDRDFIDLGALLHNTCMTLLRERRAFNAFNEKFDKEHAANEQV